MVDTPIVDNHPKSPLQPRTSTHDVVIVLLFPLSKIDGDQVKKGLIAIDESNMMEGKRKPNVKRHELGLLEKDTYCTQISVHHLPETGRPML